jgi:hypothetical protein
MTACEDVGTRLNWAEIVFGCGTKYSHERASGKNRRLQSPPNSKIIKAL